MAEGPESSATPADLASRLDGIGWAGWPLPADIEYYPGSTQDRPGETRGHGKGRGHADRSAPSSSRFSPLGSGGDDRPDGPGRVGYRPAGLATPHLIPLPTNAGYVRRFFDLAAAHRLPVYWLIPPVSPAWQAESDRLGYDDLATRFARSMLVRYPNLVVVDGRCANYPRHAFGDPIHLNARGAAPLSADLATIVRPIAIGAGPGPRWLDLPAYRDRPEFTAMMEDFGQSQVALGTGCDRATRR